MSTKISALKNATADQSTDAWHARPARVEALAPANIEQAADLGAGYVIVKLRNPPTRRGHIANQAFQTTIPVMTRERLVTALQRGGTLAGVEDLRKRPVKNEAFMRNMASQERARRTELAESGALIGAQDLADRLEVSPQAVSKALKAGRLFALEGSGGRPLYPAFYSDGEVSRRVLETVTRALGDIPASSKWQFLTTPKASLGGATPLLAQQRGDLQAVMATAAGFVER
ncbi:hypothetical protein [Rugamonas rubra]|uniref:Uncharacterized protein n=1 Tax=Rugamonas rubra TaxID=758825 RepID=A0A1I4MJD7_9BURK|nr:hypothetical protein [Rugamonas rubra]SFM03175.1 hypothetical protein SAMN02982985_02428 [Rugamonas rubra]